MKTSNNERSAFMSSLFQNFLSNETSDLSSHISSDPQHQIVLD